MKPTITFNGKPLDDSIVYDAGTGLRQPTPEEAHQIHSQHMEQHRKEIESSVLREHYAAKKFFSDLSDEQAEDGATD